MKRKLFSIAAVLLSLAMIAVLFGGCKIKEIPQNLTEETEEQTMDSINADEEEVLLGGWTYASEFADVQMPEDATETLTKATENVENVIYKPVAYLGSQVVAGVNYAYICEKTTVSENPVSTLNVVIVYRDLEGNATVTGTKAINIGEYNNNSEEETVVLAGGWSYDEASGGKLTGDAKNAYAAAIEELDGSEYEPIACLGTQVVAGTNYAILCKDITEEGSASLSVIIIYDGIGGEKEIISVSAFSISDYNE